MNEKYMICADGFENISADEKITGFKVLLRIPYYRGISLSLIDDIEIKVDGEPMPRENLRLTTGCGYTFTLAEMDTVTRYRWEYGEKARLTVLKEGGLEPGLHRIDVKIMLRISYMPKGAFSQAAVELDMPA